MGWRILTLQSRPKWEQRGGCLVLEGVPFTDDESWIELSLSSELRTTLQPGELRVRLAIRPDGESRLALWVDRVRMRAREYESLHAFAMREGGGWVTYIPAEVKRAVDDHVERYAPPRQSGYRAVSERPRRDARILEVDSARRSGEKR